MTPVRVSTGARPVPGVGDRAFVAGIPGGFTTFYVAVGKNVFSLNLRQPPNIAGVLAERVVAAVRKSDQL
jgi:hypothetical protein